MSKKSIEGKSKQEYSELREQYVKRPQGMKVHELFKEHRVLGMARP